jgi:hypothetical protein
VLVRQENGFGLLLVCGSSERLLLHTDGCIPPNRAAAIRQAVMPSPLIALKAVVR